MLKKLITIIFSLGVLMTVSGCQSSDDAVSGDEFVEQFINDFLSFKYDESSSETDSNKHLIEKLKGDFTEDGYTSFISHNYGILPIQAAIKFESDIKVNEVQLTELFHDETEIGYEVDVKLQLPSDVATVNLILSLCQENNQWKIYALQVSKVDELLQ